MTLARESGMKKKGAGSTAAGAERGISEGEFMGTGFDEDPVVAAGDGRGSVSLFGKVRSSSSATVSMPCKRAVVP
jgi:hypothetical protein